MPIRGIRPVGSRAILIELASMDDVLSLKSHLSEQPLPGQVDVLAAAETVLVTADSPAAIRGIAREVPRLDLSGPTALDDTLREIETVYDGEDLDDVAELTGLSREAVIEAHTGQPWIAAFGGFAPGFAYLADGDKRLEVPRRKSPRTEVPPGSVGLAGKFSAVYPRRSPGGWQLIGRTAAKMWDLDREEPALVAPGNRVQFKAVRELIEVQSSGTGSQNAADGEAGPKETRDAGESGGPGVSVVSPGAQSLIQDLGRYGYADLGVSEAGGLDAPAMTGANRLVGNSPNDGVIEAAMGGLTIRAQGDQVLAVTGAASELTVKGPTGTRHVRLESPFALLDGEQLTIGPAQRGLRNYVAIRGGIDVPEVLGSRATDTMSGLGPEPLTAGSYIPVAEASPHSIVAHSAPVADESSSAHQAETGPVIVDIIPGPRDDWFDQAAFDSLCGQEWEVTPKSNRVGLRLEGTPLERAKSGELPSEGTVAGSIQMPPSGLPVLFMADHPVTGGYPVIAVVSHVDLGKVAQIPPGGSIRFRVAEAPVTPTATYGLPNDETRETR
ncbi:5-oxoprolinase subunit B/C family protein [Arthrobacter pigmenti]